MFCLIGCFGVQYGVGLYFKGCPINILMLETSTEFVIIWNVIYAVQIVVLLLQRFIGGRFFIPRCFVKKDPHYSLMIDDARDKECGICRSSLNAN